MKNLSFSQKIKQNQKKKNTSLIIGLDIDINKIPSFLLYEKKPLLEFAKSIIDATSEFVVAYKPNMAFYEAYGLSGLEQLKEIIDYIPDSIPTVLDAKRGDIGNTAKMYAKAIFEEFKADSVTINPYMGDDSITPFLEYKDKYVFVLALTSNKGSELLQQKILNTGEPVFMPVARRIAELNAQYKNCGAVIGATQPQDFSAITNLMPDSYYLIPGIGAQGGSIKEIMNNCETDKNNCLFNVSRAVLYASFEKDFAKLAGEKAKEYKLEIEKYL